MAKKNGNGEKREYIRLAGMYSRSKNTALHDEDGNKISTKTEDFMLSIKLIPLTAVEQKFVN